MSETMRMWVEIIFNISYLVVVWVLVAVMVRKLSRLPAQEQRIGRLFALAFGLLALGDTGHVGFRVLAYAMGDMEATLPLFGRNLGLVGLGALSTGITITLFYVVMLLIWQARFDKALRWFGGILILAAVLRLSLFLLPQNDWNNSVPPQPWVTIRNIPLLILGLSVAALILRDAYACEDSPFRWIGIMILLSYAFYLPVILFVQQAPLLGMLMIPKTIAYVAIAVIGYRNIFRAGALQKAAG